VGVEEEGLYKDLGDEDEMVGVEVYKRVVVVAIVRTGCGGIKYECNRGGEVK